jgi:hypothetical protein
MDLFKLVLLLLLNQLAASSNMQKYLMFLQIKMAILSDKA